MVDELKNIIKKIVNLRLIMSATLLSILGVILMYISSSDHLSSYQTGRDLVSNLGSLLFVTGIISTAWELFGKRAFVDELFMLFSISKSSVEAGIIDYSNSFQDQKIDWDSLFRNAVQIDLIFWGSSTWRNHHFGRMENFIERKRTQLTVILPDFRDLNTIQNIAYQMNKKADDVRRYIDDAIEYFIKLNKKNPAAKISIWLIKQPSWFSVFRFDNKAVVSLYSHRHEHVSVPALVCSKGGKLFDFVEKEIDSIVGRENKMSIGEMFYPS